MRVARFLWGVGALVVAVGATPATAGEELVVGTREVPPFAMQDATGAWSGVTIELWELVARELGLTYRYEERAIDAMFEELADGSLDVAAAALTITSDREEVVDFSHPFYYSGLGIAVGAQPRPTWLGVMRGLVSVQFVQVLGVLLLILLAFGLLVWLFERRRNHEQFGGGPTEGIGAGFWWSAVTMTTVGYGDKAPITLGGRFVALVWMFASIIAISSITAAITSALTVASLETSVQGPEDLPHVTVGTVRATTSEQYLVERGIRPHAVEDVEEALAALAAGQVEAVVYDAPILSYAISEAYPGTLSVLPREIEQQQYGIALQLDSPLRQQANRALLALMEAGELERIKRRYLGQ